MSQVRLYVLCKYNMRFTRARFLMVAMKLVDTLISLARSLPTPNTVHKLSSDPRTHYLPNNVNATQQYYRAIIIRAIALFYRAMVALFSNNAQTLISC